VPVAITSLPAMCDISFSCSNLKNEKAIPRRIMSIREAFFLMIRQAEDKMPMEIVKKGK
jgi:hypothetical protein